MIMSCTKKAGHGQWQVHKGQTSLHQVVHSQAPVWEEVAVKSDTQVIDRFWGILRQGLKFVSRKPGSCLLECKVAPFNGCTAIRVPICEGRNAAVSAGFLILSASVQWARKRELLSGFAFTVSVSCCAFCHLF